MPQVGNKTKSMDEKGRRENAGGEGFLLARKCQIKGADQGSVRHPVKCLVYLPSELQGVVKKLQDKKIEKLHTIIFIILSSQEKYIFSKKTEVSPVILHIITFHSSNY